jgi:nickel-dependent lactate racemase
VRLEEPVDIAVSVAGYPTDIDFYQSQKSIDNAKLAVRKGGAILLVSRCREGVGNRRFIDIFEKAGSPGKAMKLVKKNFKLGYQKTYKLAEILLEKEIWGYAGVNPSVLRSCFIKPVYDLNRTLNEEAKRGKKIAFFPQGNSTIPYIGNLQKSNIKMG